MHFSGQCPQAMLHISVCRVVHSEAIVSRQGCSMVPEGHDLWALCRQVSCLPASPDRKPTPRLKPRVCRCWT